jgi:hypothetical protein
MAASTTTRLQLFLDVASELGDLITLTATAGGSTTSLVSTTDMLFPDGALNGREVWFASGANSGIRRLVTDNDYETGSITFTPAATSTLTSDVVHLVNSRGTGVTIPEIHNKINQLIRRVKAELGTETADTAATFASTSPALSVPTTWDYVLGVEVERDSTLTNIWTPLLAAAWRAQLADRKVVIKEQYRGLCHNKRVRLIGVVPLATLASDSATTTAPAVWIAKRAAAELLEAAALRSGDIATAFTFGELLKSEALQVESYVGKRYSAIGRRIYFGATA